MRAPVAVALALALFPSTALAHGKSKSFAEWILRTRTAELRINFAGHDLAASVPGIDTDGDRLVSVAELDAKRDLIGQRTIDHTILSAASDGDPLACRGHDAVVRGIGAPIVTEIEVRAEWTCDAGIRKVHVESRQLPELEPPHVTVATFLAGQTTAQHVFSTVAPAFDLDVELPSLAQELGATALLGVRAMLAPAVLLFLLGVLLLEKPKQTFLLFALFLAAFHLGALMPFTPPALYDLPAIMAVAWTGVELMLPPSKRKPIIGALFAAWLGALLASQADLPNRAAYALGQTAVALIVFVLCTVLSIVLGEKIARMRAPTGIAWLVGAATLLALQLS